MRDCLRVVSHEQRTTRNEGLPGSHPAINFRPRQGLSARRSASPRLGYHSSSGLCTSNLTNTSLRQWKTCSSPRPTESGPETRSVPQLDQLAQRIWTPNTPRASRLNRALESKRRCARAQRKLFRQRSLVEWRCASRRCNARACDRAAKVKPATIQQRAAQAIELTQNSWNLEAGATLRKLPRLLHPSLTAALLPLRRALLPLAGKLRRFNAEAAREVAPCRHYV